ncbi:hypothetical protein PAESOLCIP111_01753 [Paenibacillus solanacearum]|uniref:Uncharacterized protein n=1 Tax=Paenibacillus solanacearum TaxID=2048548 RepID=A0A916NI83_9BACL|nr:hypothetical protein [Paenibacillus solanacearum]CAG7614846.1 hypothetical protein PAESOLCIP111_01753 [Paenibacillus solanacearum]
MNKLYCSTLLLIALFIGSFGPITSRLPAEPSTIPEPVYYGDWTVQKWVGSAPISTAVDERIIGMKASYTKEKASFGEDEMLNPEYKEQEMTNQDFVRAYRTPLSDLGIYAPSVKTVHIRNGTNPGSFLMIKDEQTLMMLWDGNYFEMKKEK